MLDDKTLMGIGAVAVEAAGLEIRLAFGALIIEGVPENERGQTVQAIVGRAGDARRRFQRACDLANREELTTIAFQVGELLDRRNAFVHAFAFRELRADGQPRAETELVHLKTGDRLSVSAEELIDLRGSISDLSLLVLQAANRNAAAARTPDVIGNARQS